MKLSRIFVVVVVVLFIAGCSTITPAPYSFAEEELETVTINVIGGNPGLRLVDFEGKELPSPEKKTRWEPIMFPAGRPLTITVYAYYQPQNTSQGLITGLIVHAATSHLAVNRNVVFETPVLDPGKDYVLRFSREFGGNQLIMTDTSTNQIIYQQFFSVIDQMREMQE